MKVQLVIFNGPIFNVLIPTTRISNSLELRDTYLRIIIYILYNWDIIREKVVCAYKYYLYNISWDKIAWNHYSIRISFFVSPQTAYGYSYSARKKKKILKNTPIDEKSAFIEQNRIVLKIKIKSNERNEVKNKNNKNRFSYYHGQVKIILNYLRVYYEYALYISIHSFWNPLVIFPFICKTVCACMCNMLCVIGTAEKR